jgi:CrcB protein
MRHALAVAVGGALGSLLRWLVAQALAGASSTLPWGTLAVNLTGSLVLGVLLGSASATADVPPSALRVGLAVGVCGGFTTFSTFGAETLALLEQGAVGRGVGYAALSVALGTAAVAAGAWLGRALLAGR